MFFSFRFAPSKKKDFDEAKINAERKRKIYGTSSITLSKNGKSLFSGHHIDREEGKEYSYRHADLSKTKENIYVQVNQLCRSPYNEAIAKRIEQGYNHKNKAGELKAIRKDAVHSINVILFGKPRRNDRNRK